MSKRIDNSGGQRMVALAALFGHGQKIAPGMAKPRWDHHHGREDRFRKLPRLVAGRFQSLGLNNFPRGQIRI